MKLSIAAAASFVVLLGSAFSKADARLDGIAAVVNNEVITFAQVRELTADAEARARRELRGDTLQAKLKELRSQATADLIERKRAERGVHKAK